HSRGVSFRTPVAHSIARGLPVKTLDAEGRARQPRDGMEGDLTGVRLAECSEHLNTTRRCNCRKPAHQTALPDTRRPDDAHHRAVTIDRPVQQALHGGDLSTPNRTH